MSRGRRPPAGHLARARAAVTFIFAANGAVFGSWAPRIPEVKLDLGLSTGTLGLILLAPAIGSLLSMPLAGAAAVRWGSNTALRYLAVAFFAVSTGIGWAGSGLVLFVVLGGWGFCMGALDVVMNTQGVTVEKAYGRSILSSFHAGFSLGALAGAGVGAACAAAAVPVEAQLTAFAITLLVVFIPVSRYYLPDLIEAHAQRAPLFARPSAALLALAAAAFAVLLCEGAATDWSTLFLRAELGAGPGVAGLAYVAFSATMTLGRLLGDRLLIRYGRIPAVRISASVACLGLAAGLGGAELFGRGTAGVVSAVLGFALLGAGISFVFPALLAEAGRGHGAAGPALAAVSTGGYSGLLLGPALIGGLAELSDLRWALWTLPVLAGATALLVGARQRVHE